MSSDLEALVEQKSRDEWAQNSETIRSDMSETVQDETIEPIVDFADDDVDNLDDGFIQDGESRD